MPVAPFADVALLAAAARAAGHGCTGVGFPGRETKTAAGVFEADLAYGEHSGVLDPADAPTRPSPTPAAAARASGPSARGTSSASCSVVRRTGSAAGSASSRFPGPEIPPASTWRTGGAEASIAAPHPWFKRRGCRREEAKRVLWAPSDGPAPGRRPQHGSAPRRRSHHPGDTTLGPSSIGRSASCPSSKTHSRHPPRVSAAGVCGENASAAGALRPASRSRAARAGSRRVPCRLGGESRPRGRGAPAIAGEGAGARVQAQSGSRSIAFAPASTVTSAGAVTTWPTWVKSASRRPRRRPGRAGRRSAPRPRSGCPRRWGRR